MEISQESWLIWMAIKCTIIYLKQIDSAKCGVNGTIVYQYPIVDQL